MTNFRFQQGYHAFSKSMINHATLVDPIIASMIYRIAKHPMIMGIGLTPLLIANVAPLLRKHNTHKKLEYQSHIQVMYNVWPIHN